MDKVEPIETTWFNLSEDDVDKRTSEAADLAFNIHRYNDVIRNGWTAFNKSMSPPTQMEVTKVGYMPILQASTGKFDTLNAVAKRCMHV